MKKWQEADYILQKLWQTDYWHDVTLLTNTHVQGESLLHSIKQGGGIIIFTNPSARAGYDTRSIFKWSLTGLNSEFPFS